MADINKIKISNLQDTKQSEITPDMLFPVSVEEYNQTLSANGYKSQKIKYKTVKEDILKETKQSISEITNNITEKTLEFDEHLNQSKKELQKLSERLTNFDSDFSSTLNNKISEIQNTVSETDKELLNKINDTIDKFNRLNNKHDNDKKETLSKVDELEVSLRDYIEELEDTFDEKIEVNLSGATEDIDNRIEVLERSSNDLNERITSLQEKHNNDIIDIVEDTKNNNLIFTQLIDKYYPYVYTLNFNLHKLTAVYSGAAQNGNPVIQLQIVFDCDVYRSGGVLSDNTSIMIDSIVVTRNGDELLNKTSVDSVNHSIVVSDDSTFVCNVEISDPNTDLHTTLTRTVKVPFGGRKYFATVPENFLFSESNIQNSITNEWQVDNEIVNNTEDRLLRKTFTQNNGYNIYVYPVSLGELTEIKEVSTGANILNDSYNKMKIIFPANTTHEYWCYYLKTPSSVENYTLEFK